MNQKNLDTILKEILPGHKISEFAKEFIHNSNNDKIKESYNFLKKMGLSDEKIFVFYYFINGQNHNFSTIKKHK